MQAAQAGAAAIADAGLMLGWCLLQLVAAAAAKVLNSLSV